MKWHTQGTIKKFIIGFFLCFWGYCCLSADEAHMSKIIYLNGPSSSGKTTLAKALQQSFDEPFLHLGIDKIIGFMPAKINNWEGGDAPLGFCWKPDVDPTGHPTYHVHAGPFTEKIVRSLKDIALLLASQHYNLIIDDVAFGAIEVEERKAALQSYYVLYVGVNYSIGNFGSPRTGKR
jgi:chloramphenicol 3-O phosphotransferase